MIAYTDGSAHPNPGPGGFGVVFVSPEGEIIEIYGKQTEEKTTNNEQEMKAILYAACRAKLAGEEIDIYSDSAYAINTFTSWMYSWESNGWLKGNKKEPENLELVKAFFDLVKTTKVRLHKVNGHSGVYFNELADQLATGKI